MPSESSDDLPGFWRTTWRCKRDLLSWDLPVAVVLAAVTEHFLKKPTIVKSAQVFFFTELGALAALLGVIIAGLAIVVAFLSDDFAKVLSGTRSGVAGDLWPFWLVTALCIAGVIVCGAGALFDGQLRIGQTKWLLVLAVFFGTYAFLAAMNLVSLLVLQGANRARLTNATQQRRADPQE
jgi:hypothetical protein